jgi:hypothetical protein
MAGPDTPARRPRPGKGSKGGPSLRYWGQSLRDETRRFCWFRRAGVPAGLVLRKRLVPVPPTPTSLTSLTSLNLSFNKIGDAGAKAIVRLTGLASLKLSGNQIGDAGASTILDAWFDPATADRRRVLDLHDNGDLGGRLLDEARGSGSPPLRRGGMLLPHRKNGGARGGSPSPAAPLDLVRRFLPPAGLPCRP